MGQVPRLAPLVLVLPGFTLSAPRPRDSTSQLVFAGLRSLVLWAELASVQTIRHRDDFLPPGGGEESHLPPSARAACLSL